MGKKVAIMQPYFFPYLGYFQLINSVNEFVLYDDVNFIKQGWINRNYILSSNQPILFTVPLQKVSSFQKINETNINFDSYFFWKKKFNKTIDQCYSRAPYYSLIKPIIDQVLDSNELNMSELAFIAIKKVISYLEIDVKLYCSSKHFSETINLNRENRIVEICNQLESKHYINPLNGSTLYDKNSFKSKGIELSFINCNLKQYQQFSNDFVPNLSIIDLLMFNSKEELKSMLGDYKLT